MPTTTTTVTTASASGTTTTITTTEAIPEAQSVAAQVEPETSAAGTAASLKLVYFNGTGLAELSRMLLSVAGVNYEDKRYPIGSVDNGKPFPHNLVKAEMEADANAGKFDCNLGRLPILEVDGAAIGGSKAVARYISNTYGLMGANSVEAAQIDSVVEIVGDIFTAFDKQSDKEQWFSGTGSAQGQRELQWHLRQLEKVVGSDGYAVGSKVSYADVTLFNKLADLPITLGLFGNTNPEPMNNNAKVTEVLAQFPNVAKIVSTVAESAAMKAYLAARPVGQF
jgi:glutathione S-transferase